jgi:hypothetical protein
MNEISTHEYRNRGGLINCYKQRKEGKKEENWMKLRMKNVHKERKEEE